MSMEVISQQISNAIADESATHLLRQALEARAGQVARLVELPATEAADKLLDFIVRYIEDAPQMLDDLQSAALEAGLTEYVQPVVKMASEFSPCHHRQSLATPVCAA